MIEFHKEYLKSTNSRSETLGQNDGIIERDGNYLDKRGMKMTKIPWLNLYPRKLYQSGLAAKETSHAAGLRLKVANARCSWEIVLVPTGVKAYMQPTEGAL